MAGRDDDPNWYLMQARGALSGVTSMLLAVDESVMEGVTGMDLYYILQPIEENLKKAAYLAGGQKSGTTSHCVNH